jgi:hypothetical protein
MDSYGKMKEGATNLDQHVFPDAENAKMTASRASSHPEARRGTSRTTHVERRKLQKQKQTHFMGRQGASIQREIT